MESQPPLKACFQQCRSREGSGFAWASSAEGCRTAPAPLESKSKKGLSTAETLITECLSVLVWQNSLVLIFSAVKHLHFPQMQMRTVTNKLFLLLCAQLAFTCIILFNGSYTYSHPVDIGYNSLLLHLFTWFLSFSALSFPFGSYLCCNEFRLCDPGMPILLNQRCPGTSTCPQDWAAPIGVCLHLLVLAASVADSPWKEQGKEVSWQWSKVNDWVCGAWAMSVVFPCSAEGMQSLS